MIDYLRELNFVSVALRLLLSAVIGFSLGMERGRKRRPAGCRTYMLVCMGATLTLLLSQYEYYMLTNRWYDLALEIGIRTDVSRFGAQVINGVGFLGAGTILVTGRREVKGLTTAAGLWASACMGLAIGAGFYESVVLGTVLIFLSMRFLPTIENMMVERAPFLNIYVEFESLDNIGAIIGRIKEQNSQILDVEIDLSSRVVTQNGKQVLLTLKEYELLLFFARNPNIALYREVIYEQVWEKEYTGDSRTIDLHVQRLKKKLGWDKHICAVYKIGYRLET